MANIKHADDTICSDSEIDYDVACDTDGDGYDNNNAC